MKKSAVKSRSEQELKLMRESGKISALAVKKVLNAAKEGVTLKELEEIADLEIIKNGGKSAFKTVPGYSWTTCLNINDEVVHGIPREIVLKKGDILSIDLGAIFEGWYSDTAWSVLIGSDQPIFEGRDFFLKKGEEALWKAIDQAVEGNHIGDISAAIQETIEGANFSVVRSLIGHGVGKTLHEAPEIPGIGKKGSGLLLKAGMTLAIEVIYTSGDHKLVQDNDGWTIRTEDGSLGGLFEMTVVVGSKKAEVLTDWRRV